MPVFDRLGEHPRDQRGALTGPDPTDRGKKGSKIHLTCDRNGLPPVGSPANRLLAGELPVASTDATNPKRNTSSASSDSSDSPHF
ncbi:hypothetical protein GCM10010317_104620 [Streptomyces mirabilis]|nr:hypothetical protein GCM10010317_104620 [Streptomyces mirabilis]